MGFLTQLESHRLDDHLVFECGFEQAASVTELAVIRR